ncbi:MAG: cardiolipin synthase, partial [Candidatus Margulisiibacteriota bacterium]
MEIVFHLFSSAYSLIFVVNLIFILAVLFSKKSPAKIFSWLLVLYFMPLFGFVLYLFFGIDWRKRSIVHRLTQSDRVTLADLEERTQEAIGAKPEARRMKALMTMASVTTRLPVCANNSVQVIHDPSEAFEAICSDMLGARHHIHLEFYIIQPDSTGSKFLSIVLKKADEQVKIRIIVDAVGSKRSFRCHFFDKIRAHPNVEIIAFQPIKFPLVNLKANYRNHRKMIVVDGALGYLGGMNIGDEYLGKTKRFGYWRDTMIRLEGQSAQNIQTVFFQDWHFVKREKLPRNKAYYPDLSQRVFGNQLVQMVTSSPHANWDTIAQLYFGSITAARETLYITTPYFIPDEALMRALKAAVLGGV